jgi:hypothetical protein
MIAYENLRTSQSSASSSLPPPSGSNKRKSGATELLDPLSAAPAQKRRQSSTNIIARELQPKPASNGSPIPLVTPPAGTHIKKRGRPSKADVEQRQAEAIARGEVLPPPKTPAPKGGRQSTGLVEANTSGFAVIAPTPTMGSGPLSEPSAQVPFQREQAGSPPLDASGKKKRARPSSRSSKVSNLVESARQEADDFQKALKPGESSFSITSPGPELGKELGKELLASTLHEPLVTARPAEGGSGGSTTQTSFPGPSEAQLSAESNRSDV